MSTSRKSYFDLGSPAPALVAPAKLICPGSHKMITLLGGELIGGACARPPPGLDIYVSLDSSGRLPDGAYPWDDGFRQSISIRMLVTDHCAPADPKLFGAMVDWLLGQLRLGRRIHVGCIGGHGRTGTVLAALIARGAGRKDAIQWVRDNYCDRAVESDKQVEFLVNHYGTDSAKANKPAYLGYTGDGGWYGGTDLASLAAGVFPARNKFSIWVFDKDKRTGDNNPLENLYDK